MPAVIVLTGGVYTSARGAGNSPKLRGVYTVPAGNSPKLGEYILCPPVIVLSSPGEYYCARR